MRHFTSYSLLSIITHLLLTHTTALTLPLNPTAPNPPPTFSTKVHISDIPIDPITAYVAATETVFSWTLDATKFGGPAQWDVVLTENLTSIWFNGLRVKVTLRPPPERPSGPPNPMKFAYAFLGIYKAVASITEDKAFEVSVELHNSGRHLADLEIFTARPQDQAINKLAVAAAAPNANNLPPLPPPQNITFPPAAPGEDITGIISYPSEPALQIHYTFRASAPALPAVDIFTACLDAMLLVTTRPRPVSWLHIDALSASNNVYIHMETDEDARSRAPHMDAYLAQWVVGGLAKDAFAGRGVFKAVEWVVMYKGDVFAKGRFFKAPKEVGGGGVAETA